MEGARGPREGGEVLARGGMPQVSGREEARGRRREAGRGPGPQGGGPTPGRAGGEGSGEVDAEAGQEANRVSIQVPKVTEAELQRRREEQAEMARKAAEASRTAVEEEYERMVLVSTNQDDSIIEAGTVEDAVAQMTVAENPQVDRHPERKLKASFKVNAMEFATVSYTMLGHPNRSR